MPKAKEDQTSGESEKETASGTRTETSADTEEQTSEGETTQYEDTSSSGDATAEDKADESRSYTRDYTKEYVEKLRKENAKYRTKSKKTETDFEEFKNKMETRAIRTELKAEAIAEGLVDLDALKLFDSSKIKVTDEGDIVGVKELVASTKKAKPYLFKDKAADTTGGDSFPSPEEDESTSKSALEMDDEEYAAMEAEMLAKVRGKHR